MRYTDEQLSSTWEEAKKNKTTHRLVFTGEEWARLWDINKKKNLIEIPCERCRKEPIAKQLGGLLLCEDCYNHYSK